eukprot:SAG11_NODE_31640_length_290_cov_0.816754_1_plen_56_part_00
MAAADDALPDIAFDVDMPAAPAGTHSSAIVVAIAADILCVIAGAGAATAACPRRV